MTADKEVVKNILESDPFTRPELQKLVEDRSLNVDKRKPDEMIQALLSQEWTEEELEDIKDQFLKIQKEKSPLGHYIGEIASLPNSTSQAEYKELKEVLLINEAAREDGELLEEGFEILKANPDIVEGIYWTQTQTYQMDALNNFRSTERTYNMGLEFDLNERRLRIIADNFGKLGELTSELEKKNVEIDSVGHEHLTHDEANEKVRGFVEDLDDALQAKRAQTSLGECDDSSQRNSLLEVDTVQVKMTDDDLKTADIEGRSDIFDDEYVRELTQDRNGRISQLEGTFEYEDTTFSFNVGYPNELGRVRVKKQGRRKGEVEFVEEVFDFFYEYYDEYFVNV